MNNMFAEFTKEQITEISRVGIFDFITSNYTNLTKEQITVLLREYSYAVYEIHPTVEKKAMFKMLHNLDVEEQ